MLALFRMVEAASGSIVIDGIDISTVSLKHLRSRVSIIPQDPVLFSGTVSFNIDPTEASTDNEIWEALDKVHLGDKVRSLEGGLQATVSEYGDMFSTGQRQLVCVRIYSPKFRSRMDGCIASGLAQLATGVYADGTRTVAKDKGAAHGTLRASSIRRTAPFE